jgi:hypothetical protein
LREEIIEELEYYLEKEERITEELIDRLSSEISSRIIQEYYDVWKNSDFIKSVTK